MHAHIKSDGPHTQSSTVLSFLRCLRASNDERALNNRLPDAKILKTPLSAGQLARLLKGRPAGEEWWFEGWVIGEEAWIDDRARGEVFIRCRDIKGLLKRAEQRGATPAGIVLRYAPSLRAYTNARVQVGKRSDVIYKITRTLLEAGALLDEVQCVISASAVGQDKFGGDERRIRNDVERVLKRIMGSR